MDYELKSKGGGGGVAVPVAGSCCPRDDPPDMSVNNDDNGDNKGGSKIEYSAGSSGCRSRNTTNPEEAFLIGVYLLSLKNLMYFS